MEAAPRLTGEIAAQTAMGKRLLVGDGTAADPKRGAATCDTCDQQMLCRIAEKAPFGGVGGAERDD